MKSGKQAPAEEAHTAEGPGARHTAALYWIALLAIAAILVVPFWTVDYPGMNDYPNHLTRCFIIAHYHASEFFQARYIVVAAPLPNLAIDLIVTPLNHFLPLLLSGKLFLSLMALLYLVGCIWLGYAITGKRNWIAPLAALTLYNSALIWGFVNYLFGIGVFLCAFAFWMQSRNRMSWQRFLICCVLSIAAYLSHLSSVMFLGVACVAVALLDWRANRSVLLLIRQLAWLVCPIPLMIGFSNRIGNVTTIEWATWTEKVGRFLSPILTYNPHADAISGILLFICIVVLAKNSKLYAPSVAGAVLLVFFLISPDAISSVKSADARYVVPGFLLLLLSLEPRWTPARKIALFVATLVMAARVVEIAASWRVIDQREHRLLQMGENLPEGARIYVVQPTPRKLDRGFRDIVNFWTISHNVTVSTLFLLPGQQPLQSRQPPCDILESHACLADYDYIWTFNPVAANEQYVRSVADESAKWESVTLWKIRR